MQKFRLNVVPAINLAPGALLSIARQIKPGKKALIIADPIMESLGHVGRLQSAIEEKEGLVEVFSDIVSDPKEESINEAIANCAAPDLIVALGGGSTMDASKVIAALLGTGEKCEPYRLAAKRLPARKAKLIAVPTTAGTGSEATNISVLSSNDGIKYWYAGKGQEPDEIILDPELMTALPAFLTAATGCDALVHAMEAATSVIATPANNIYAYEAIRLCMANLPTAVREPENLEVRASMAYAATLGGIAINNGGTAIAHCIGHAFASLTPMHHGLSVTLGMSAALPDLVRENKAFDQVATCMGLSSRDEIPAAFDAFAKECSLDVSVDIGQLSANDLLCQMLEDENQLMLKSTVLEPDQAVLLNIAEKTLAYANRGYLAVS